MEEMENKDKRQAIMQTVEKLFSKGRIHEITLDEVARLAQVGKGTIYRYFRDKDDLFLQVAMSGFDELCGLIREGVSESAPFEEQLLQMCVAMSDFYGKRREIFQLMQAEDARMPGCPGRLRERWLKHRERLVSAVASVIERGARMGYLRDDVSATVLARFLLSMLRARALDFRVLPEFERRYELMIDVFLHGAESRAEGVIRSEA